MSISGWSRLIAARSDRGRHRRGTSETNWEITSLELSEQSAAEFGETWQDPPTGLQKFNLGTIPASVTPPRTWRRAAWFAGGTAAFVAFAMGLATILLNGHSSRRNSIEALPAQPSQRLTIADLPTTGRPPAGPAPAADPTPARTTTATAARPPSAVAAGPRAIPQAAPPVPAGPPVGPAAAPTRAPTPTMTPFAAAGPSGAAALAQPAPRSIGALTEMYFHQVVENPRAAYELTSGRMRQDGAAGISRRYAGIERIEIRKVSVDRAWWTTRTKLLLVFKDGRSKPVERQLTFSSGPDPRIISDRSAG
ncbi:hypothetical protein [Actinophytocola sp.]|uniref:hypothetical protein n=1 Tax=Actinophytocola sp. TaxID=1872138 RepID=UPI002D7F6211|nr:hypothetical protein [Actinophytocola sp.]HET9140251.1 hypothetical protein [Actinophytocola sp.]